MRAGSQLPRYQVANGGAGRAAPAAVGPRPVPALRLRPSGQLSTARQRREKRRPPEPCVSPPRSGDSEAVPDRVIVCAQNWRICMHTHRPVVASTGLQPVPELGDLGAGPTAGQGRSRCRPASAGNGCAPAATPPGSRDRPPQQHRSGPARAPTCPRIRRQQTLPASTQPGKAHQVCKSQEYFVDRSPSATWTP